MINTQPDGRYALSFTSGGLLAREAALLAPLYLVERDWATVRYNSIERNLLQARTTSSNERVTRETIQRLSVFNENELHLLVDSSHTEQTHLMWVAACRRYDLIGDFAEEVLRERFLLLTPTLDYEDFDRFIAGKSLWHPEINELKPSTRAKLRQTMFRMMHEAALLSEKREIIPAVISERVQEALMARNPSDTRFFPTTFSAEVNS